MQLKPTLQVDPGYSGPLMPALVPPRPDFRMPWGRGHRLGQMMHPFFGGQHLGHFLARFQAR
jgi:hypothetical protein